MAKTPAKKKEVLKEKALKKEVKVELNPVLPHIRDFTGGERAIKVR